MISRVIDKIDADITWLQKKHGLCETIVSNDTTRTGKYLSKGEFENVANIDKWGAVSYWLIDGEVDSEREYLEESNEPFYRIGYDMVMRLFVKSNYFTKDSTCSKDDLYYKVMDSVTDFTSAERAAVGVRRCDIEFNGYSSSGNAVIEEDFGGTLQMPLNYHVISIKVRIEIVVHQRCLSDNC